MKTVTVTLTYAERKYLKGLFMGFDRFDDYSWKLRDSVARKLGMTDEEYPYPTVIVPTSSTIAPGLSVIVG